MRAADPSRPSRTEQVWKDQCHTRTARRRGGQASPAFARPLARRRPDNSSLHDVSKQAAAAGEIRKQKSDADKRSELLHSGFWLSDFAVLWLLRDEALVEPDGIEPTTSCLQSRRSPN